jgi:hypothetical protein
MAATTAMATSFKSELMQALHNFLLTGGNTFKLALIKVGMVGTYGAASTNYSNITGNTDEATGTNYSAGGGTLTRIDPTMSGTTAFTDFADLVFSTVTISAVACMIYNSTSGSRATSVHDFGGTKTATAGDMTIQFPTPDATNAILRLA